MIRRKLEEKIAKPWVQKAKEEAERADRFDEQAKLEVARADRFDRRAKLEAERAENIWKILRDVDNIILNAAGKLQGELPEFYREIHYCRSKAGNARDLVGVLIQELEENSNRTRNLEQQFDQLELEINGLAPHMHGKDSEAIEKYQKMIVGLREDRSNKIQEAQDKIEKLVQDVSLLEEEKRRVEEGQRALKLEHKNEMQKLKDYHEKKINDTLRAQKLAESALEAKHDTEKMNQQRTYDAQKIELQNSLQAKHDIEKTRQQRTYDVQKRELQNSLQAKHNSEKSKLQAAHDAETNRLQRGYDAEEKRLCSIIAGLQGDLDAEKSRLQAKISEIQNQHETEKNRLREDYESKGKRLAARILEIQQNHKVMREQMEQKHQATIMKMEQTHKSTIGQMEQGHESERAQWHATKSKMLQDHKSEKDLMQKVHDFKIAQMSQEYGSKQAQLIARISQMEKEHVSEQEKMKKDFEVRKLQLERETASKEDRLMTEFKVKKAQLEMAQAEEKERLTKDIDEYSTALLARDDFKPTPDSEIKARFLDFVQDVDALARLEWKVNQKEWTSQVLRRLSPNQRLLKKQILQDSIWVILHKYIFCSPFKIFGEEGLSLETKWNEECGKDSQLDNGSYTWPKPEMKTERWRYVNIKECRAALTQPLPSEWDPRAKLKKGFKASIDALRKEFTSTLSEIADLDKSSVQAMEKMTIKAANMWLEFGMQRCRILVVLRESNLKPAEERIQRAQEDALELVVVPELTRFGNSKGLDLDIEETVGGCDGETVEVSMRRWFCE